MSNNIPANCGVRNWWAKAGSTYSELHANSHLCTHTHTLHWPSSLFLVFSACCHNYCCTSLFFITCARYPTTNVSISSDICSLFWHVWATQTDDFSPLYVIIVRIWAWWGMENVNYSLYASWETRAGCKHGRSSDFRALIRSVWRSREEKKSRDKLK